MSPRLKIGLAVGVILKSIPNYLMLRPPSPPQPHSEKMEVVCSDPACGFSGTFSEEEALTLFREHGTDPVNGIALFHCPSCKPRRLYRSELGPLEIPARKNKERRRHARGYSDSSKEFKLAWNAARPSDPTRFQRFERSRFSSASGLIEKLVTCLPSLPNTCARPCGW